MPDYFAEMCSGSEAGTYSRLTDVVYHSTLGLGVIKKRRRLMCDLERGVERMGGVFEERLARMLGR